MHSLMQTALAVVLAAFAFAALPALGAPGCKGCHADFASVLPKGHPAAKGTDLGACLACHKPDAGKAGRNGFAAALHRGHVKPDGGVPCTQCHAVRAKGKPGTAGGKVVLVASRDAVDNATRMMKVPNAATWTAGRHAKAAADCGACHGPGVPPPGAEVGNDRCLACHGPMEKLVEKTKPAEHADRNPHRSHLGDIACSACHKGHEASKVYCLDCHPKWPLKIQGAG